MDIINKIKQLKKPKAPWKKYYTKEQMKIEAPEESIYSYFEKCASQYLDKPAYDYFGTVVSYKQFINDIDKCARAFRSQGIRPGDVVTICMPNTPEAVTCFYAINKIGAIANMVHPLSGEQEIKNYLVSTKSVMLVMIDMCYEKVKNIISETDVYKTIVVSAKDSMPFLMSFGYQITRGYKVEKPKANAEYIYWKEFIKTSKNYNGKHYLKTSKDQPAVILHSGGTTGNPKGILLKNGNFTALVEQARVVFRDVQYGDSVLAIMPIFHGFGLGVSTYGPNCLGCKLILLPQFDSRSFGKLLQKNHPNILFGVPTLYEALLKVDNPNLDLSCIKYMVSGGDSLNLPLEQKLNAFLKQHGCRTEVAQGYGMTESLAATAVSLNEGHKLGSIGIPFPGNYYKIVKPGTQDEVPVGEDGEICVCGPTVMMGYLDNEKETNEVLQRHSDGYIWLHTGDIGCMDEDGAFYYRQRLKRMIISSGYNVYPQQIESVIEEHEAVLKCTVIGIPHPYKVEVAKAYIVLKNGYKKSLGLKKSIKDHCKKYLAQYSIPYEFEFRESLPKTLLGKVDVMALAREEQEKDKNKDKSEE